MKFDKCKVVEVYMLTFAFTGALWGLVSHMHVLYYARLELNTPLGEKWKTSLSHIIELF